MTGVQTCGLPVFWDTAGQELYRSMGIMYYNNADAAILVYSIDDVKSFESLEYWIKELEKNAPPKIKLFVVANKTDLVEKELVKLDKGKEFAEKNNGVFKLTSAKDNLGINELFTEISIAVDKKPTLHEDTQQKTISGRASLHKKKEKCC